MNRRSRTALLGTIAGVLFSLIGAAHARAQDQQRFGSIEQIVTHEIAARHIPGAVILIGERGGIVYWHAFGARAVLPQQETMSPDTVFDLASLTKVIATATAVMQLVEAKQLALADPVDKYWPRFGANGKGSITIEQLLTHMSGLRPDLDLADAWSGETEALARIAADQPLHRPGSHFLYSDLNFIILGELVRRVSGEPLDVYCAQHIFRPLGMRDTDFNPDASEAARIAPTGGHQGLRRGHVQDPTADRMGGVAGHAGLFSTADDLAKFAEMLLGGGSRGSVRILSPQSVARMTAPHALPRGVARGLGWDIASPFANGMDAAFGPGSYGHTGYTGTSLWIDPASQAYLIILASRLHPDDRGDAKPLRREISAVVAAAEHRDEAVLTGIDVLADQAFAPLAGLRVGLLTNQTGRDAEGRRTIDLLANARGLRLQAIFSPEHGLDGDREGKIESGNDPATGLPIYSLYGSTRRPTSDMLDGLDALVVDLQDVGARFFTYATTVAYAMEASARRVLKVFILDRPNPIGPAGVRGPVLDAALESFTGYFPMPVQHGMTLGELAAMFNAERHMGVDLTVVPMRGYRRRSWYDETSLPWVNPSPNLRSLQEAILYPGVALVEGTNVSVGRGTARPFELVGAPWIDGSVLARYLVRRGIAGVTFAPVDFTPTVDRYAGNLCYGVRISITDRAALDAPRLGLEIAAALHRLYPSEFTIEHMIGLIGSRATLSELQAGADPATLAAHWEPRLRSFETIRAKYLLYR